MQNNTIALHREPLEGRLKELLSDGETLLGFKEASYIVIAGELVNFHILVDNCTALPAGDSLAALRTAVAVMPATTFKVSRLEVRYCSSVLSLLQPIYVRSLPGCLSGCVSTLILDAGTSVVMSHNRLNCRSGILRLLNATLAAQTFLPDAVVAFGMSSPVLPSVVVTLSHNDVVASVHEPPLSDATGCSNMTLLHVTPVAGAGVPSSSSSSTRPTLRLDCNRFKVSLSDGTFADASPYFRNSLDNIPSRLQDAFRVLQLCGEYLPEPTQAPEPQLSPSVAVAGSAVAAASSLVGGSPTMLAAFQMFSAIVWRCQTSQPSGASRLMLSPFYDQGDEAMVLGNIGIVLAFILLVWVVSTAAQLSRNFQAVNGRSKPGKPRWQPWMHFVDASAFVMKSARWPSIAMRLAFFTSPGIARSSALLMMCSYQVGPFAQP